MSQTFKISLSVDLLYKLAIPIGEPDSARVTAALEIAHTEHAGQGVLRTLTPCRRERYQATLTPPQQAKRDELLKVYGPELHKAIEELVRRAAERNPAIFREGS